MSNSHKSCTISDNKKFILFLIVSIALVIISFVISICVGAAKLSLAEFFEGLLNKGSISGKIIWNIRLPRTLATIFAGCALAVAGAVIQSVLNNPLASPNIIGVNSGAGFGVVLTLALFPTAISWALGLSAFLGALVSVLIVYFISKAAGFSKNTLILAGVALNALLVAGIDALTTIFPNTLSYSNSFKIGGVSGVTMASITPALIIIPIIVIIIMILSKQLDILALGDEVAVGLGLNCKAYRFIFLLLSCILAGVSVSFCGLIGFVGLVVPHIVKLFFGHNNKVVIIISAFIGAAFLTICDVLARCLFMPYELPVGILLAFIGVPFFIYLLLRRKKRC